MICFFVIESAIGDVSVLPNERNYELVFENVSSAKEVNVSINFKKMDADVYFKNDKTYVNINGVKPTDKISVKINKFAERKNRDKKEYITEIISKYQMNSHVKYLLFTSYIKNVDAPIPVKNPKLKGPVEEIKCLKY